jgi:prepilin-type N-terminal cleavage/methylation domain-containing protein/prepilin-type processing-associated H-X9-DG protein
MQFSPDRRRGFTLVELLVVIGVIALLSAILLPVFGRVRETGRRTACTSNMKQLALAFQQYANDASDRLPGATDAPAGVNQNGGWIWYSRFGSGQGQTNAAVFDVTKGTLFPYVKATGVYLCPSDGIGRTTGLSYAINACASRQTRDLTTGVRTITGYSPGKKISSIKNPTMFMLLTEETRPGSGATGETVDTDSTDDGYYNSVRIPPDPESYRNVIATRHNEGGNVAFLDGHVKWYKREQIIENKFQIGGEGVLDKGCPEFQNLP